MSTIEETGLPPSMDRKQSTSLWAEMGYVEKGMWVGAHSLWWAAKIVTAPLWLPFWGLGYLVSKLLPDWEPWFAESTPRHY